MSWLVRVKTTHPDLFSRVKMRISSGCRAGLDPRVQLASIINLTFGGDANRHRVLTKGAVAQLGERLICIQEVAGSIPTSSTNLTWACSSGG
jgi:hypothetical protein